MPFNLNFNSIFLALLGPGKPTKRAKEDSGLQEVVEKGTDCRTDQEQLDTTHGLCLLGSCYANIFTEIQ